LWTKTTKEEIEETLREIATISSDMLDRVWADFGEGDLYMQIQTMDVAVWTLAQQEGHGSAKHLALRRYARNWHEVLGLQWVAADWELVVTAAVGERGRDTTVDNRAVWARVLSISGSVRRAIERSELLIRFYLSLSDGTGTVERQLGRHAAYLDCHGPGALSEACLEIAVEGPEVETEIATQRDGHLLLTACSRQWAELWVATRGRRFGVYKLRADVGRKCRLRYQGSLKSVQARVRAALDSLVKKARRDQVPQHKDTRRTVVGHRRNELFLGAAARDPAPQSKKLASFRKVTRDRVKAKKAVRLWRGIDKTLPPARPKMGDRLPHMVAAPSSTPRAAAPRLALARPRGKTSALVTPEPGARPPPEVIVVDADLPAAPLKDDVLKTWLPAIAYGKTVSIKATKAHIRFQVAVKNPA